MDLAAWADQVKVKPRVSGGLTQINVGIPFLHNV